MAAWHGSLEIQDDDILDLDRQQDRAALATRFGYPLKTAVDRRDLRGDDVTIDHR